MRGAEIIRTIKERAGSEHRFVRWWRKETDFLDYDLLDRFMASQGVNEEIGGVELLTMDEMWNELKRVGGDRVRLVHTERGDSVEWVHGGKKGMDREACPYTPETILNIYDIETRGNPVDS